MRLSEPVTKCHRVRFEVDRDRDSWCGLLALHDRLRCRYGRGGWRRGGSVRLHESLGRGLRRGHARGNLCVGSMRVREQGTGSQSEREKYGYMCERVSECHRVCETHTFNHTHTHTHTHIRSYLECKKSLERSLPR